MSIIERIKAKIQKLKQRINELKCRVISKHQVIETLMHQTVILSHGSFSGKADLIKDTQMLIDNDTDKVRKLKKKIAKKETLLHNLEEYLTLYYKKLEIDEHKFNGLDEKLIGYYFNVGTSDRMKELELKIDKPKLFKRDDVISPVCPYEKITAVHGTE